MGNIIPAGSTKDRYNLKAGTGRLFVHAKPSDPSYTAFNTTARTDNTAVTNTITLTSVTGLTVGSLMCVPRTGERFVVSTITATPGAEAITVASRGIDGTVAQAIPSGTYIAKIGNAFLTDVDIYQDDTTGLAIQLTLSDPLFDVDKEYVLRTERQYGEERMYLLDYDGSGLTIDVKRNINLAKNDNIANTIFTSYLIIVAENYDEPSLLAYRKSRWLELEFKDAVTITSAYDTVDTDSNLRIGPSFANHLRWSIQMNSVITDPGLQALLYANIERQTNASATVTGKPNQQDEGFDTTTFFGEQVTGIWLYLMGRESSKQFQASFYECAIQNIGDITLGTDQRMQDLTFNCIHSVALGAPGVIRNPLSCV